MPGDWEPARVAQLVATVGLVAQLCWVRPWAARRELRATLDMVDADVRADVAEGFLPGGSAAVLDLRRRLFTLRHRPARAVRALRGGGLRCDVSGAPPDERARLTAYVSELEEAAWEYVRRAHPIAWWQLTRAEAGVAEAAAVARPEAAATDGGERAPAGTIELPPEPGTAFRPPSPRPVITTTPAADVRVAEVLRMPGTAGWRANASPVDAPGSARRGDADVHRRAHQGALRS